MTWISKMIWWFQHKSPTSHIISHINHHQPVINHGDRNGDLEMVYEVDSGVTTGTEPQTMEFHTGDAPRGPRLQRLRVGWQPQASQNHRDIVGIWEITNIIICVYNIYTYNYVYIYAIVYIYIYNYVYIYIYIQLYIYNTLCIHTCYDWYVHSSGFIGIITLW